MTKGRFYLFTLICVYFCLSKPGWSQLTGEEEIQELQSKLIEEFIENIDGGEEFDYNTLFEDLKYYLDHSINLNQAKYEDLKELRILNDLKINAILNHRESLGPLISLYELQSIPSLDLKTIRLLLPFVTVNESDKDYHNSIPEMLSSGSQTVYLKWRRVLEKQKGYKADDSGSIPYSGDPNRIYLRYRFAFENKLKFGVTAEKDAGEPFFKDPNNFGFDYYSWHVQLRETNRILKDFILGDYTVSFGQGLIIHNQFGAQKNSDVINIKKAGRVFRPYSSVNEVNYFRGAATSIYLSNSIELSLFSSLKHIDANLLETDTNIEDVKSFSSIVEDGYHRTALEFDKKGTVNRFSSGGQIKFRRNRTVWDINFLFEKFDKDYKRNILPYNQFQFQGKSLLNLSLDYSHRWKNFNWFGEIAMSDNGALAQVHGAQVGLDQAVDFSILYRNYGVKYQALNSNSFAETTGTTNENGIYLGLEIRPHRAWILSAYADLWKHQWLRFRRDSPTVGSEYLVKLEYYKKRKYEFYIQYKAENKPINASDPNVKIDKLVPAFLQRLRIHFNHKINQKIELRNRLEFSIYNESQNSSHGFLFFQDVLYRPLSSPISVTGRIAFFDIGDFNSRIYAFENDLLYEFFIPFYQYRGWRYYLNLRYDWGRSITSEFRISRTYLNNRDEIGSGNEVIDVNHKTEIKAQLRLKF